MTRAKLSIDATHLATAAHLFGCSADRMAWALEPAVDGECGWLGGCHEPNDPTSASGHCTRHDSYIETHRMAVAK